MVGLALLDERLPQPELDLTAQRAHLPLRLSDQPLSQIIIEAEGEASIFVGGVSHGHPLAG